MRKRWTLLPADDNAIDHLQKTLNINPVFCRLLVQRGITTFEEAKAFFRPNFHQLHDPFLMEDMDKATKRIELAILKKEKILLFGDYDVDGTTCVALLFEFLFPIHPFLEYYIPDRYKEGYGISEAGINYANEKNCSLIIAMDCGIRAVEKVAFAKSLGIDFIICDHHLPDGKIPAAAAVLDPMRPDCNYPYRGLSGCGVVFKLAQAITQILNLPQDRLFNLLDILVLSIAADIVPMTGENRTLAHFGLIKINNSERVGINELIKKSRRKRPMSISDLVFGIAPMINAAGRLGDAKLSVKILITKNKTEAIDLAHQLHTQNELRKAHDKLILDDAKKLFTLIPNYSELNSILLFNKKWHKGVVGIAAARMVEAFHKPTILLTESNGVATGSARSVPGFKIYDAIKSCEELLTNFGGHDHAAGMTLPIENIPAFQKRFEEAVKKTITKEMQIPELKIAALIDLNEINFSFWNILKQFAPFGPGNRSPVFVTKNVIDSGQSRLLKGNHMRVGIKKNNSIPFYGIAFNMGEHFPKISSKKTFHIAYKIVEEHWQGEKSLKLMVRDFWFLGH
ncbi:MAG: single-stranded-DNA-specific exonuclease RecJ [Bacteroidota bacterium]